MVIVEELALQPTLVVTELTTIKHEAVPREISVGNVITKAGVGPKGCPIVKVKLYMVLIDDISYELGISTPLAELN